MKYCGGTDAYLLVSKHIIRMGIKNLSKALKRFASTGISSITIGDLKGMTAAIDAAIYVYKFLALGLEPVACIKNQALWLRSQNIEPIYFLDGPPCVAKQAEIKVRRTKREKARKQPKVDTCSLSQIVKRFTYPTKQTYDSVVKQLHELKVTVYQSRNDGEKACAWAVRNKLCDFVFSEDFDCIPYNAPIFITGLGTRKMKKYDVNVILSQFGNWTQKQMIIYCILLGSDLCPSRINGVGMVRAKTITDTFVSLKVLSQQLKNKMTVPVTFEHDACAAILEFMDNDSHSVIKHHRSLRKHPGSHGSVDTSPGSDDTCFEVPSRGIVLDSVPSHVALGTYDTVADSPRIEEVAYAN